MAVETRVLADFDGKWQLRKSILKADGTGGSFEGTATWTRTGAGAEYAEEGQMMLGTPAPFHATRRYHWSAALDVYFEDGRFFHRVPAAGGAASHWCDPDRYDVVYDFSAWPAFRVSWRVNGPRKDYTMDCHYTRP